MASKFTEPDHYVFPGRHRTKQGGTVWDGYKRRNRNAVRRRILCPAIKAANVELERRGLPTIPEAVAFHSLRRTYASLAAEAGIDPAWTAAQIGHRSARFTLDVYTDTQHRRENPAERIGSLVGLGTSAQTPASNGQPAKTGTRPDSALEGVESGVPGG